MNSASLCRQAGRYENPIPPQCLAPIDFLKIPALAGEYDSPIPTRFLGPIDCLKIPALVTSGFGSLYARCQRMTVWVLCYVGGKKIHPMNIKVEEKRFSVVVSALDNKITNTNTVHTLKYV
jgi:hypothetical protein